MTSFKNSLSARITTSSLALILVYSFLSAALINVPLYEYATNNVDINSLDGLTTILSIFLVVFTVTFIIFALILAASTRLGKFLIILITLCNAIALYFMLSYQVILDKDMMGNVFNTNTQESMSNLSFSLFIYVLFLGVLPCLLLFKLTIRKTKKLKLFAISLALFVTTLLWLFYFSSSWLWFDQHGKQLGGKVLPWSYIINASRYQSMQRAKNTKQTLLPQGAFNNSEKQLIVLVIGETARAHNFIQYGYDRDTTPYLIKEGAIPLINTTACATYTTASLRCILSHLDTSSEFATNYEPLPSYLKRHGVDVIWRTNNWGEPKVDVNSYQRSTDLRASCTGLNCEFDGVLLTGLEERITQSNANKIFVVLHLKGSHGPEYFDQYPKEYEHFKPVCESVELKNCTEQELINAYDNSILYTDFLLSQTIDLIKQTDIPSTMLYISDHGESLGENGLYLHGTPYSIAPKFQTEIPFFVWISKSFLKQKNMTNFRQYQKNQHSQLNIFHSVVGAFGLESPVYQETLDIFAEFKEG